MKLYVEVSKLEPSGIPPLPRFLHSAENIGKYLYVFGGWNDSVYSKLKNSALNDLNAYDIELNQWTTIALYGKIPMSWWGHCMSSYK